MGMRLQDSDLLPGEHMILSKAANAIVSLRETGIAKYGLAELMIEMGMRDADGIGGKAHLTNFRILFKSHFFNRVRGSFSVFLPNVQSVPKWFNGIFVETDTQSFQFEMWHSPPFIQAANDAVAAFSAESTADLVKNIMAHIAVIDPTLEGLATQQSIGEMAAGAHSLPSVIRDLKIFHKITLLQIIGLMRPR